MLVWRGFWDRRTYEMKAETTKERILAAALAEFAANGIAGGRVDRIAEAAACNKNLIYIYFTDKESLFADLLQRQLARLHAAAPIASGGVSSYCERLEDFTPHNSDVVRLLAWASLERREELVAAQRAVFAAALRNEAPHHQVDVARACLAAVWAAANPFSGFFSETASDSSAPGVPRT
jgi:AcrR family transcriptional regulator